MYYCGCLLCVYDIVVFKFVCVYDIGIIMIGYPIYFYVEHYFFSGWFLQVALYFLQVKQYLLTCLEKFVKDKKQQHIVESISQEILKTFIGMSLRLKYLVYFCVNKIYLIRIS